MRTLSRRGFTLAEMLASLCVTGAVVALACSAALGQLRFFRGVGEVVALRAQIGHAAAISSNVVRDVATGGDIVSALDSAFEAHVTIGAAFACETDTGKLTVPAASPARGNTLGAYSETPQATDIAHVSNEDSAGLSWIRFEITATPAVAGHCALPGVARVWTIPLREPLVVEAGAAVRITRRMRLSLYRASDHRWYLGLRDWNGAGDRFNAVQPVAGPLRPYSSDPARTGLLFQYRDAGGAVLASPADPQRVSSVSIITRSESIRPVRAGGLLSKAAPVYADSLAVSVALRNRP